MCLSVDVSEQNTAAQVIQDQNWKETKQFRDPVYGYIQVPVPYVRYLIDTSYMQRIKGIAQSGLRPLFAAATHDRFAHSIGVYRFAMLLYDSFCKSALDALKRTKNFTNEEMKPFEDELLEWKNLLAIASILHDIGHPIQSHAMEFLYDDVFLKFPDEGEDLPLKIIQKFDADELDRTRRQYQLVREQKISYEHSPFTEAMAKKKGMLNRIFCSDPRYQIPADDNNYKGNPHERMSTYYILTDKILRENIRTLCNSYRKEYFNKGQAITEVELADALDFICRMITGTHYRVPTNFKSYHADQKYSMRNCVISILNGTIDADSIDYIMRNSYSSGYETSEVDHYRFCSALSVYIEQGQMFLAWRKSALSVIEGFISARNYEPRWLYSHHKVVYQDILMKEMLIDAVEYLSLRVQESSSAAGSGSLNTWIHYPFFTYILSPFQPFSADRHLFYQSVDGDIENFFKQIALEMEQRIMTPGVGAEESELIHEYLELYHESDSRQHKKSLWKSFSEYKQAITAIARRLDTDFDTINRYTLELIRQGLMTKGFHLAESEGKENGDSTAGHYQNEVIYYPRSRHEQQQVSKTTNGSSSVNSIIAQFIPQIFENFDPKYCRIKVVCPRIKDFSREQVLMGGKHYMLSEMLDLEKKRRPCFPYLFYRPAEDASGKTDYKGKFFAALEAYCRRRLMNTPTGGNMSFKANKGKYIRDVVHGDIFLPERFLAVIDTPEFQRLRRIKQLATATQVFPNAGHSRFSHSLGTYHVMTKIIEHFERLCAVQGMHLFHSSQERDIVLLSALLHDVGHGPYSHAFEHVSGNKSHEEWTAHIILDRQTRLNTVLRELFGEDSPQRIVDCINHKAAGSDSFSFSDIYPTLISSQLDADRLDYLMRDSYNTAIQFGNVDIQSLISSMRITVIDQRYSVAIDEANLSMVEHFLFGRFKMYETVYYNNYKLFSEELLQRIFKRVGVLIAEDDTWKTEMRQSAPGRAICSILQGINLSVQEYLLLDDAAIEAQFARWAVNDGKDKKNDPILTWLVHAFLHRNQISSTSVKHSPMVDRTQKEIFRHIRVFHEQDHEIQALLGQIESLLRRENVEFLGENEKLEDVSHAFINIFRHCDMYRADSSQPDDEDGQNNTIWVLRENGTVEDIGEVSRMLNDSFQKSYLYYCEEIFWEELKHCCIPAGQQDSRIPGILNGVKELMETSHPRNMIEIEEKYSCNQQALEEISQILRQYTRDQADSHDGFYLEQRSADEVLEIIEQEDIYYDLAEGQMHEANCSLRCRQVKAGGSEKYIFTIKTPTESKNFGKNEQFARFEFEMKAKSNQLDEDVVRFIRSHLDIPGLLKQSTVRDEDISKLLSPVLNISNRRRKGIVYRNGREGSTPFKAEICLDSVLYKRSPQDPDETGKPDWQIELELKSDYLDRVLLRKFTSLLRNQNDFSSRLKPESTSKYSKARQLLGLQQDGEEV